jgi:hypothetical protein
MSASSTFVPADIIWVRSEIRATGWNGARRRIWKILVGNSCVELDVRSEAEAMEALKYLMRYERAINGSVDAVKELLNAMPG